MTVDGCFSVPLAFRFHFHSMLIRQTTLIIWILLAFAGAATASWSRFVVITPANETEYPIVVQVEAVPGHEGRSRIRVIGDVGSRQRAWLVVCRTSVNPCGPYFRDMFWFGAENEDVKLWMQLFPEQTLVPGWRGHLYPYVELELPAEQMHRAYIYIDFSHPVDDGGYYYSIDLAYYLKGALGKKGDLKWEAQ